MSPERERSERAGCPEEWDLALFVDGRLPDAERRAVWEHVQTCEACEEVVGAAAHLLEEGGSLAGSEPAPAAAPSHEGAIPFAGSSPKIRTGRWLGPLVGLAATLVVGGVLYQGSRGPLLATDILLTGGLVRQVLPSAWPNRGWATRGSAAELQGRETAFRAGVWMMDLQAALSADDAERARQAAASLRSLLTPVEGAESSLLYYDAVQKALTQSPPDAATARRVATEAEKYLASLLDRDALALGRWMEAASLATRSGDRKLLAAVPIGKLVRGTTAAADPRLEGQLRALAAIMDGGVSDQELAELGERLDQILARGGGS